MDMKNHHKMGLIRPEKIYEALLFLKENHPEYKDINISDCDQWMQNLQNNDENTETENYDEKISTRCLFMLHGRI